VKGSLLIAAAVAGLVVAFVYNIHTDQHVATFYGTSLRGSLFSGFLGLGGFLLSLKTFIVVKMKEGLYDHKLYRARHAEAKKANPTKALPLFAQLGKLRTLLFASIISSLLTAVLQITVGLADNDAAAAICLGAGGFTLALLGRSLYEINGNLRRWFEYLEIDADEKEKEALTEVATQPAA
jgi:hypothetical protein